MKKVRIALSHLHKLLPLIFKRWPQLIITGVAKLINRGYEAQTQGEVTPLLVAAYTAAMDAMKDVIAAKDALIQDKEGSVHDTCKK